ncbi:MAG: thioredoxin family protein [Actinomycetes bacterium]
MVAVNSTMLPLGTVAPPFSLPDPSGVLHSLADAAGAPATLVMFLSNHCPYVQHLGREVGLLTQRWQARGVAVFGVMSNDIDAYPDDAPDKMVSSARGWGWDFPYLVDTDDHATATAYRAACTPDFFLFDAGLHLVYRGQFDGSRPGNDVPVTGADLRAAVDAVLEGEPVGPDQRPSMGCNIKWRPGRAPDYFA